MRTLTCIATLALISSIAPAQVLTLVGPTPAPADTFLVELQAPPGSQFVIAASLDDAAMSTPIGTTYLGSDPVIIVGEPINGFLPVIPPSGVFTIGLQMPVGLTVNDVHFQAVHYDGGWVLSNPLTIPVDYGPPVATSLDGCGGDPFGVFCGINGPYFCDFLHGWFTNLWPGFTVHASIDGGPEVQVGTSALSLQGPIPGAGSTEFFLDPQIPGAFNNGSTLTMTIRNHGDTIGFSWNWLLWHCPQILSALPTTLNVLHPQAISVEAITGGTNQYFSTSPDANPFYQGWYDEMTVGWAAGSITYNGVGPGGGDLLTVGSWFGPHDAYAGPFPQTVNLTNYAVVYSSSFEFDILAASTAITLDVGSPIPAGFDVLQCWPTSGGPSFNGDNRFAALGDFNADGIPDLACSSALWPGDGACGFDTTPPVPIDPFGIEAAAGDVNGDGFDDLVNMDAPTNPFNPSAPDETVIHYGNGSGALSGLTTVLPLGAFDDGDLELVDVDGDTDLDVVVASGRRMTGPGVQVFLNGGGTTPTFSIGSGLFTGSRAVAVADFDGDGDQDIVCDSYSSFFFSPSELKFVPGDGTGTFSQANATTITLPFVFGGATFLDAVDMDGDGHFEILWSGEDTQGVLWNLGQPGQASFQFRATGFVGPPTTVTPNVTFERLPQQTAVDIDNDGDMDVASVVVLDGVGYATLSINDAGTFTDRYAITLSSNNGAWILASDMDQDGDDDLVVGGSPVSVLENRN